MTIEIKCYLCGDELEEQGALILSPPFTEEETTMYVGKVDKYHICKRCWKIMYLDFLERLKEWLKR